MPSIDDVVKLEVLEGIAEALGLRSLAAAATPADVRPAAEKLLLMSSDLWNQATLLRQEPMGQSTLAGQHPVLISLLEMDDIVWDTLARLRPKYVIALKEKNATVQEFVLKSASIALTPRDGVPIHRDSGAFKQSESVGREDDDDVRADVEAFYSNYRKYRPASLRTQADVASAAGISVGTVATIEKLRAKPHYGTVVKIAAAFGVTPEQMLKAP